MKNNERSLGQAVGGGTPDPRAVPIEPAPPSVAGPLAGVDWYFVIAAVGLGWIGSYYWWSHGNPQWWKGYPFQLASLWFLWKAFQWKPEDPRAEVLPRRAEPSLAGPLAGTEPAPRSILGRVQDLPWFLVLIGLAWAGQYFFLGRKVVPGLGCWAGAIAIFWSLRPWGSPSGPSSKAGFETLLLLALMGLAASMRFPFLEQHFTGLQIDEGLCITDGHDYASGRMVSPFITTNWGANASFHFWWLGHYMRIFGESVASARGFSAMVSLGVLWVFYHWARLYFGPLASGCACFLMSCGWWFLFYSLSPFQNILVVFWEVLAFYYFGKALRDRKKSDYFRTGLFLAMMGMEYLPGRVGVGMAGLAVLGIFAVEGRGFLHRHLKGILLAFLSMLWLAGPFIRFFFDNLETVLGRTKQLSLLAEVERSGNYFLLAEKWFWTFLSFLHNNPGFDLRFCAEAPMIDPLSGALFVFGLCLALMNLKKPQAWILLSGLFFGMLANAMAIQGQDPDPTYVNGQRYFLVTPFLFLAAAWAMDWTLTFFLGFPNASRKALWLFLCLGLMGSLVWNSKIYYWSFRDFKKNESYYGNLGFNHIQVADFMNSQYPRYHLVVDEEYFSSVVEVLTKGKTPYSGLGRDWQVPLDKKVTKDVLFLILRWSYSDFQERIKRVYPNAKWGWLEDPSGRQHLATVVVPLADILSLQKDGGRGTALP